MTLKNLQAIREGKLWSFQGGVHPKTHKNKISTAYPTLFEHHGNYIIHLHQHIGEDSELSVKIGDRVLCAQPLTRSNIYSAPPVHAPTSGTIVAIEKSLTNHPSAIAETAITIKSDGKNEWCKLTPIQDPADRTALINAIHQAGICGMGGAGFPTAIKIASRRKTDLLIINGAECEPYISADDTLMQHYADELRQGIAWVQQITNPDLTIVAIEDDKPKAIAAMQKVAGEQFIVRAIPAKYPSGGKKQLTEILTGQEVPAGGLSADLGLLMLNVGTVYAIHRAIDFGEPLIRRIVTLAGKGIKKPRNMWVNIGTPIEALLPDKPMKHPRLIIGGPMMGYTLPAPSIPVIKTTNCVLYGNEREFGKPSGQHPCIRCGECANACPINLLPQQLYWFIQGDELDKAEEYHLKDCIECGACAYVCPSDIPLVQYYRQGKATIRAQHQLAIDAEHARQRTERRNQRLEREKQERENRHKQAAAAHVSTQSDENSDAIAAAIARVKAKQQAQETEPKTADSSNERKSAVNAAVARARAKKSEQNQQPATESSNRKDAVAAAVARAKAKKAEQNQQPATESSSRKDAVAAAVARAKAKKAEQNQQPATESSSRKDAVAAAVARAKAKKAEQDQQPATESSNRKEAVAAAVARAKAKKAEQNQQPATESSNRKEAVAAAVARAKAKKAEQDHEKADETPSQPITTNNDAKKAAIAAAVAKAKAKKLAEQQSSSNPVNEESSNS
ncbi:electron transport complex subunit RsxC [Celerinatantimonas diazotrophica]|uniref:Ion-translocating oxidoreductase complex subunit C n=1 Tax=Celerinatantimonas diazotrophica TaxID=412034 RepID=A0A4R1JAJ3_9GAMM|nr:electron transport complex subunit RsxC [Celerinatantimonas diazotrophica]TCK47514.1 electron transport complex protein RnfC [Celerinatantimonas diazotrophica]CAG9296868.1 Ion-translocating oxidoreductase complex subunit C [Celerinatantimonas diazotrophica]